MSFVDVLPFAPVIAHDGRVASADARRWRAASAPRPSSDTRDRRAVDPEPVAARAPRPRPLERLGRRTGHRRCAPRAARRTASRVSRAASRCTRSSLRRRRRGTGRRPRGPRRTSDVASRASPSSVRAPRARPHGRRTGSCRRPAPDTARGPCRRSPRRRPGARRRPPARSPPDDRAPRRSRRRPSRAPGSTSAMIASGSSDRGLSLVMIVRSAAADAAAPIRGRLARSRSPPQPNTTISRPDASGRAACSTERMLSGVCA